MTLSARNSAFRLPNPGDVSICAVNGELALVQGDKLADSEMSKIVLSRAKDDTIAIVISPIKTPPEVLQLLERFGPTSELERARKLLGALKPVINSETLWTDANSHSAILTKLPDATAASIIFKHSSELYWIGRSASLRLDFPDAGMVAAVTGSMSCRQSVSCKDTSFLIKGSLRF